MHGVQLEGSVGLHCKSCGEEQGWVWCMVQPAVGAAAGHKQCSESLVFQRVQKNYKVCFELCFFEVTASLGKLLC